MKKIFLVLYLIVGLVPLFDAADKYSPQLLYLQFLNSGFIIWFIFLLKKEHKKDFIKSFSSILFLFLLLFFSWSFLSISVAINKIESLKTLTLVGTYLTSFSVLYYLIHHIKGINKLFVNLILIILSIEIFTVITPFLYDLISFGSVKYRSQTYSGLTGNINIAAFSILIKLPFAIYKAINSKRLITIIANFLLILIGTYAISSILSTRGAILGILLISLIVVTHNFVLFFRKKIDRSKLGKGILIILLPLVINIVINSIQTNLLFENDQSGLQARLESVTNLEDQSNNSRLRYWKQSFLTGISNPVFGIGIGNWKLKGIETDNDNLVNYVVPYHTHNDFLEIFAETGVLGFLFYGGFLITIFVALIYFFIKKEKTPPILFYLILSFVAYFMDASLNFPFARPIQQIGFFSIMIFSVVILKEEFKFNDSLKPLKSKAILNFSLVVLILLAPFSLYSSIRIFNSSRQQYILLGQFNFNIFNTPLSEVEDYEDQYPNISETTIPLKTLKGIYNLKAGNIERAIDFFQKGIKDNPYLMINQTYLGYAYSKLNNKDSALYYSKKAFKYQPNNISHFAHYVISLSMNNDSLEIKNAYNQIKSLRNEPEIDKIYYLSLSNLLDKDDTRQFIDQEASKNLLQSDETDNLTRVNLYILQYGKQKVLEADILYELGQKLFEQKKFLESAQKFEEAGKINPLEMPYFENAANAYLQISNHEKALENINYVIENSKAPNGKAYYIKALIYFEKGEKVKACDLLKQSAKNGFRGANNVARVYCN